MLPRFRIGLLCLALLTPGSVFAHPGSGIVVDRAGNVYFVRAGQNVVWKLDAKGSVSKYVEDDIVRLPHHLFLDKAGTLYFASDFDGRIWRVDPNGKLLEHFNSNRIKQRAGNNAIQVGSWGDPWTLDSLGNVYALATPNGTAIVRLSVDGAVTPIGKSARFKELHFSSMTLGPDGALYVTDANRVWRVVGDSATRIESRGRPLEYAGGIAAAWDRATYIADWSARRVVRLGRDGMEGTPPTLAGLSLSQPMGVTVAPDSSVYVLDLPAIGGVAIWRVHGDTARRVYVERGQAAWAGAAVATIFALLLALQTTVRVPKNRLDWLLWCTMSTAAVFGLWWFGRSLFVFEWLRHPIALAHIHRLVRPYPTTPRG